MSREGRGKPRILISHSHEDKIWVTRLQDHLDDLKESFDFVVWDVTEFQSLRDEIVNDIDLFRFVVILVSPRYLASQEMRADDLLLKAARDRGATILPILVEPFNIGATYLDQFQFINRPSSALSLLNKLEQERVLNDVTRTIIKGLQGASNRAPDHASNQDFSPSHPRASHGLLVPFLVGPWRLMRILQNLYFALVIVCFVSLMSWLVPRIGARMLGAKGPDGDQEASVPATLQGDVSEKRVVSGILSVRIPKSAKISETFPVQAEFQPDSKDVYRLSTDLKLESPSFKITLARTPRLIGFGEEFRWVWLILPEKTGRHAVSLRFDPEIEYKIDEGRRPLDFEVSSKSIIAYVTILTDLNLTSTQDAILKVVGVVLGVAGTIFAFPFLKRYFEN